MNFRASHSKNNFVLAVLIAGFCLGTVPGCIAANADDYEDGDELVAETAQAISWKGHSYLFLPTGVNWDQAVSNCKANGYYLVTINSATEQQMLYSQQANFGGGVWWIGLNDRGYEGTWIWATGTSSYRNWAPGQPDNAGNEDCVVDRTTYANWNDRGCDTLARYICERNF